MASFWLFSRQPLPLPRSITLKISTIPLMKPETLSFHIFLWPGAHNTSKETFVSLKKKMHELFYKRSKRYTA